jgi:hypothetical protein
MQVANSKLVQPPLQTAAIGKGVKWTPHAAALSNITEGINTCILDCAEELGLAEPVRPNCHNVEIA